MDAPSKQLVNPFFILLIQHSSTNKSNRKLPLVFWENHSHNNILTFIIRKHVMMLYFVMEDDRTRDRRSRESMDVACSHTSVNKKGETTSFTVKRLQQCKDAPKGWCLVMLQGIITKVLCCLGGYMTATQSRCKDKMFGFHGICLVNHWDDDLLLLNFIDWKF